MRTTTSRSIGFITVLLALLLGLSSCAEASGGPETTGPAFTAPAALTLSPSTIETIGETGYVIDTSTISQGYVSAAAVSASANLKFQVTSDNSANPYNYDLPNDGTIITCPINMGNGAYTFAIWENTTGTRYLEFSETVAADVVLDSEFEPFIRPSFYCFYTEESTSVKKARELAQDATNQGDVLKNIYNWIVENVEYDTEKARTAQDGYVPEPDSTMQTLDGICFDYASLAAAMLRSQGIPCKIMTGYVSPDNIYHAWNMVYIDGTWETVGLSVDAQTWTRIDTTFAAGGSTEFTGDGTTYTDRYTY